MSKIFIPPKKTENKVDINSELIKYHVLRGDGTAKPNADVSWNNYKIVELGDATNDTDAVNKKYVDEKKAYT
jgi:hypothetical protein